jgi:hypothetical protein
VDEGTCAFAMLEIESVNKTRKVKQNKLLLITNTSKEFSQSCRKAFTGSMRAARDAG